MSLTAKVLNTKHSDYDEMLPEYAALYSGGSKWHSIKQIWMPRHPQEIAESYTPRMQRAEYENNAGPIADLLAGGLFTKPPIIEKFDAPWAHSFLKDVDGKGTPLSSWVESRVVDAMVGKRVYVWLNLPRKNVQFANRSQEERAGALDVFLVDMQAEDVIDWETTARGGLKWIMHRGRTTRRKSIETERVEVHTWTYIDDTVIRTWEWSAAFPGDTITEDTLVPELEPVEHRIGEIPVACLKLSDAMHVLGKLRDPAVALLRSQNDLDWGLHRGAHALLWIRSSWEPDKPLLGSGAYYKLGRDKDGEDSMGYAEPSGATFELLANRITQQREGMFRAVHQMANGADGNATRAQMSASSKAEDWRATEIVLSAYAAVIRPFVGEILRLTARIRSPGKAMSPTVAGLAGWAEEDLGPWLLAAAQATLALSMSETFHRILAKKQARRLMPSANEEVMQAIEAEIDKADVDLNAYVPGAEGPFGVGDNQGFDGGDI